jgi:hypothetical protein
VKLTGPLTQTLMVMLFILLAMVPVHADSDITRPATETNDITAIPLSLSASVNGGLPASPSLLSPASGPAEATPTDSSEPQSIEWGPLLKDSFRFLMLEHAYRMPQRNTRAGFSGPFFQDYFNSVANIHGWGDGDKFGTNYIGHPMEGAIAGYLEVAHDPRYRRTTFDLSSKQYWTSRLRATAFAAAYSLQFEIGPISEASLGNVQQNPKATGVVDWVITPTVGLAWIVAEDAVDAKLIAKWETGTKNRAARIALRGLLNPSRSFSNLMRLQPPWHRDTRPGITHF